MMNDFFGCIGCPFDDPDFGCLATSGVVCHNPFAYPDAHEEVLTDA